MRPLAEYRDRYPLPEAELLALALAVTDRLAEDHAIDLVHGGLRAEALAWDGAGACELAPGPVAYGGAAGPGPGAFERLAYLSPEQVRGERPTLRSDMFSLGALLYEAACGLPPHHDDELGAMLEDRGEGRLARFQDLPGELSLEWEALLSICLSPEPRERYASALDLLAELRLLERRGGKARLHRRPHWPRILLMALVLVALAVALVLLL